MPIDARIALGGVSPAYDTMGAFNTSRAAAQTARANQMTMQAAQDTSQRAEAARVAARNVNFMNPAESAQFLSEHGADVTEPYLAAGARAAGTDVAQATGRRAQVTQDREGVDRIRGAWGRGLVSALADSSDAGLAALRGRLIADGVPPEEVDATLAQLGGMAPTARVPFIRNLASTNEDARKAMELVAPKPQQINRGGTIAYVDMNPYSPTYNQEIRSDTVTASPNRQQLVQDANGNWVVVDLPTGAGTPATLPSGAPVTGDVPGTAPAVDPGRAAAATTLRDALSQLRTNFGTLYQRGFMRGEGVRPAGNVAQYVRDRVPFLRGVQLSGDAEAATASDSIDTLLSTAVSTLSSLYGTSSRVMDAVKEMENVRKSFGSETMTYEAAINAVDTVMRRVDQLEAEQGGGAAMPPVGARGATLTNSQTGASFVSDGTRWVPR